MTEFGPENLPEEMRERNKLESIFFPYARKKRDMLFDKRFVHYTTADSATKIIASKRLWLRNVNCMADFREVQHGYDMLQKFFSDEQRKAEFSDALDSCFPNIAMTCLASFDHWWNKLRFETYIASISEHEDFEDQHGRLSMWRAFGGSSGRVAMVFRLPYFSGGADALRIQFSPVAYFTESELFQSIEKVIENVKENCEYLRALGPDRIMNVVFFMLSSAVTCLKHEGFLEEKEWRITHTPALYVSADTSPPLMEQKMQVVSGIPQLIYELPLDRRVSDKLADLDISKILDRIIIGPSQFSIPMHQAFVELLHRELGFLDAAKRVIISGIPIRS